MDIVAINEAIQALENDTTTFENVQELACLYIVRDNLTSGLKSESSGLNEVDDILPYYNKYVDIKRRYQLHQTSESEVIAGIKSVCKELEEFITQLYQGTDMNKERICIKQMIQDLSTKYE